MKYDKKICVVGGGKWGKNHIRTLNDLSSLGGIVDSNKAIVDDLKTTYPNVNFFDNIEDAINFKFDGFIVATPAETHFEITKKILESKYHVLVEKPMTIKLEHAIKLNEISKTNNVNLMVGHVMLFHPAFQKIKEMINLNIIGDLQYIYSNRVNLGSIRSEENVFWSLAPHDISIFQYLIEKFPKKINSIGANFLQKGIHDSTITTLEYPNNIMGHIFVSWLHPFKEHRFVVVGSEGMISYEDSKKGKPLILYDKKVKWNNKLPFTHNGSFSKIDYDLSLPLENEIKYFLNHLDGEPIELSNGDKGVEVIDILNKASNILLGNN